MNFPRFQAAAFTLIEVLMGLVVVAILVALFLPRLMHNDPTFRPQCMNNLKQVGLETLMWANDHDDKFPWQASTTNGGAMELIGTGQASLQFRPLSEILIDEDGSRLFVCPADSVKVKGTSVKELHEENVSYFLNADAATNGWPAQTIMAGDRNLQSDGQPVKPGLFLLTRGMAVSWTAEMHHTGGEVIFMDGHVEWMWATNLTGAFMKQPVGTNRVLVP